MAIVMNTEQELKKAVSMLAEATDVISGPRRRSYGAPRESLRKVARLWEVYLQGRVLGNYEVRERRPLTGRDVANMMVLFKVARESNAPSHDNLVDICGYAALAGVFEKEVDEDLLSGNPKDVR